MLKLLPILGEQLQKGCQLHAKTIADPTVSSYRKVVNYMLKLLPILQWAVTERLPTTC